MNVEVLNVFFAKEGIDLEFFWFIMNGGGRIECNDTWPATFLFVGVMGPLWKNNY